MGELLELPIPVPRSLERTFHPLVLPPDLAETLQRMDILGLPGRGVRARGQSRCSDVSSSSTTVKNCGVFQRADCKLELIDANANGDVRLSTGGFGAVIGQQCAGPAPDCTDLFRDPDVDCNPGQDCAAAADSSGAPYDVDWTISTVAAGSAFSFIQFPTVRKLVRACVGAYDGQIYKPARLRNRIINSSGYCVLGQFRANLAGLSCGQLLKWRGNGDSGLPGSSAAASSVVIWSFCLENGATLDWAVDWAVVGQAQDCGALALVSGLRATWRCAHASPDSLCSGSAPWNTLTVCAACP
jgi:hypothetical protein